MKALIVDDEMLARKRILELLTKVPEITEVEECQDGEIAIRKINSLKPDLIFLDINLQDMTGFDILMNITTPFKPSLIFVTAYDSFALQAYDFDPFDFLLKPFKEERFYKAVQKVLSTSRNEASRQFEENLKKIMEFNQLNLPQETALKKLPIRLGNKTTLIDTDRIRYISASGYYAEIFTDDDKYLIRESLSNLDKVLNDAFYRIHRSTIVNLNYIQDIVHSDYGQIDIRMKDKMLFSVSKTQKAHFLKKLGLK